MVGALRWLLGEWELLDICVCLLHEEDVQVIPRAVCRKAALESRGYLHKNTTQFTLSKNTYIMHKYCYDNMF